MPTIEQNLRAWGVDHDWPQEGDEWSRVWGGPEPQWFGSLYPRIHAFLPAKTILEIAPGFGRWTQFLKTYCEDLIVVDLAESCIEACKKRFHADSNITYHVNDGKALDMIPAGSIDFVFCFDSLVHAEADVIEAYLGQLSEKLNENGVGFIHHSNIGMFVNHATGQLPFENRHWRAESMTFKLFEEYCEKANLQCITQELIDWGEDKHWGEERLTDCISLFTLKTSVWNRPNTILINDRFMNEAEHILRLSRGYGISSFRTKPCPDE